MRTRTRSQALLLLLTALGCSDPAAPRRPESGSAVVRVIASGSAGLAPAYRLLLDDSTLFATSSADSLFLENISPGAHAIRLEPLDLSCVPDWYVPQPVIISAGHTSIVAFAVQCDAVPSPGILFASTRDNALRRSIYRMDPDGGNVQRLTSSALGDDFPVVSPGGTRVVYQHQAQLGLPQIWLMDVDGGRATKLTASNLVEQAPTWAPDGRRLAFIRWTDGDLRSLIIASPDGRLEQTLVEGRVSDSTAPSTPHWSPDGQAIAFGRWIGTRFGIRVVDVNTKAFTDFLPARDSLEAVPLAWTPDGKLLFCRLQRHPAELCDAVIAPLDGSSETVLAPSVPGLVTAAYSIDGGTIALTAYSPANGPFDIFRIAAAGGSLTNLTNSPMTQDLSPSWVP